VYQWVAVNFCQPLIQIDQSSQLLFSGSIARAQEDVSSGFVIFVAVGALTVFPKTTDLLHVSNTTK
jgi:hypothetical protein